jgi:hypothetical protein
LSNKTYLLLAIKEEHVVPSADGAITLSEVGKIAIIAKPTGVHE